LSLRDEIFEQPAVVERLLRTQREPAAAIAAEVARRDPRSVFIAARGSSDNAALYAKYLWGSVNRLPVGLATPSLFTAYGTPPRLEGSFVVGISQSGQSPDIVSVAAEGRRQGALTLAVTNEPESPLAQAAELVLETVAGEEKAIAATKTYTSQLAAIALLSAVSAGEPERLAALDRAPELLQEALALDETVRVAAEAHRAMDRCVVLGRGFNYATAYEWALKLKELTYAIAEPYSPADFQHGPVAIVSRCSVRRRSTMEKNGNSFKSSQPSLSTNATSCSSMRADSGAGSTGTTSPSAARMMFSETSDMPGAQSRNIAA
jgi:glucosamine--fructose-6-phosphate aminotransferase (isomerizing)